MTLWNYKFRIFLRKSDVTLHHAAPRLSFCSVWHHSVGLNLFWRNWRIVSCHHLELCFYFFPGFIAHLDIDFFLVVPCLSALNDPNLYASLRMYTSYLREIRAPVFYLSLRCPLDLDSFLPAVQLHTEGWQQCGTAYCLCPKPISLGSSCWGSVCPCEAAVLASWQH